MIREVHGDLLGTDAEALVILADTDGRVYTGRAYQVQAAYPLALAEYREACQREEIRAGTVQCYCTSTPDLLRWLIFFPLTTRTARKAQRERLKEGLFSLWSALADFGIRSVAIPRSGWGPFAVHWRSTRLLIEQQFSAPDSADVQLYFPAYQERRGAV